MSDDKAIGKSISFRPGSLHAEAEAYGRAQRPTLNASEVVCHFVRVGLDAAPSSEMHRLAAELTRLGGSPEMALRNALAEIERDAALSAPAAVIEWKPAS